MEIERVERILMLWFDVERQYKTINGHCSLIGFLLWFDVERQYKTMRAP